MTEESIVAIVVCVISSATAITVAIIGAMATIKAARMKGPKIKMEEKNKPLDIPEVPQANTNPFDLLPEEQEFGSEEYYEAIGTRLMERRESSQVKVRKIIRK